MNYVTKKYVNILHLKCESATLLWSFKLLMRAGKTTNSLNACYTSKYVFKVHIYKCIEGTLGKVCRPKIDLCI